jgi:hypothetical protein
MRRTAIVIMLLAVLAPVAAWAGPSALGDGTLSVRNGDGAVRLDLDRGVVIGRIGAGALTLYAPADLDCGTALVWDEGEQIIGDIKLARLDGEDVEACVYRGENLRFRLVGADAETIRLAGENVSLSAVGRGRGQIKGRPGDSKQSRSDGTWSLNGEEYTSLPDDWEFFPLATPIPPPE